MLKASTLGALSDTISSPWSRIIKYLEAEEILITALSNRPSPASARAVMDLRKGPCVDKGSEIFLCTWEVQECQTEEVIYV